ncbi:MAG TPA: 30S ribosome-binding factor RbfA [Candidatus Pacearchaeota archaeon]|mgnify:FL=1|nr:30S ribosome-binding factor RbfA [Candidatus Pacearchaeota archaeon]HQM24842.1 30S ribosome-binding factor RbfA [Candidatus Pacearchaeota archaeon]
MWKIEKVNAFIQKELGNIILKEVDIFPGILLTITRVDTSANLIEAKVYVSVLPEDQSKEVMDLLNRKIYFIQQVLNKKLKIRPVPKIIFKKESKTGEASRIEELLMEIDKKKEI